MKIKIAIADDHLLFLQPLSFLLNTSDSFEVVIEATDGQDLIQKLKGKAELPDLILVDVNMPLMDGIATTIWLQQHLPQIKIIALSMQEDASAIMGMYQAGCCAYLLKTTPPIQLEKALLDVYHKGYYHCDSVVFHPARLLKMQNELKSSLTAKEKAFLQLACSELTYKEIAAQMHLSARTVDGYRESLFLKLGSRSRVGLCLQALKKNLVSLATLSLYYLVSISFSLQIMISGSPLKSSHY